MRRVTQLLSQAAPFIAALALAACATQSPPANPQGVIKERVAIMKSFVGALTTTTQFTQEKAVVQAAKAKVAAAREGAERLEGLFPPGTALGDRGVVESRALSTIFANRDDFNAKRMNLAFALAALDTALAKSTKAEVTAKISAVKTACLACHKKYRTADE